MTARKPPLSRGICDEPPHFRRGLGHGTHRTGTTERRLASNRPHSRLPGTEGRSRLGAPSGAGEVRGRWPRSGSAASSTSFGLTHAPSHKQTDAVQVGGQYRQCNGVRKPIGAVGAHSVETAMLKVVDCRLDAGCWRLASANACACSRSRSATESRPLRGSALRSSIASSCPGSRGCGTHGRSCTPVGRDAVPASAR